MKLNYFRLISKKMHEKTKTVIQFNQFQTTFHINRKCIHNILWELLHNKLGV